MATEECEFHIVEIDVGVRIYTPCFYCEKLDGCQKEEGVQQKEYDRREQESDDARYEHYHPRAISEDDQIINSECDRKGIPRP